MTPELRAAVFALPVDEKLKLVEELWDSIAEEDAPPLSAAQLEELERRWKKHLENPGSAIPGEEFFRRLEARYGR
ncbi:MAG TPA: addiction module protein [Gemmataceae bacterium]|jgi:putative addiction module component (TIGR02574 family)|nr:addiction module protein [Gemmataceae bacterium]